MAHLDTKEPIRKTRFHSLGQTALRFGFLSLFGLTVFSPSSPIPYSLTKSAEAQSVQRANAENGVRYQLTQGKADIITTSEAISDVVIANPDIVEVRALQPNRISIIGLQLGSTNILLLDEDGGLVKSLNIDVSIDEKSLRNAIEILFPNEDIRVKTVGDEVVLSGRASNAAVATAVRDLALRYTTEDEGIINMIEVEGDQQVMINVRVLEVSRTVLNELGIETEFSGNAFNGEGTALLDVANALGLTIDPSYAVGTLTYNNGGFGPLSLILRALERDGMVNTLAEPNLTAISGENARFLAGGEFPVPSGIDQNGNIVYEYRPFGVSLAFKPIVLTNDRISLQVSTEVSEISADQSLQLQGITIPSFNVRRAETTIELGSGGSLMLAGLIESQTVRTLNEIPGLRKIPVIGQLISSESFQRNESELIIMITAYTVKPFAENKDVKREKLRADSVHNIYSENNPLNDILHYNLEQSETIKAAQHEQINEKIKETGYIIE